MLSNGNEEDKRILKCISTNNIRNQQKSKQQKKNCINKVLNIFILIGKNERETARISKKEGNVQIQSEKSIKRRYFYAKLSEAFRKLLSFFLVMFQFFF
jgi:hypothetical protein